MDDCPPPRRTIGSRIRETFRSLVRGSGHSAAERGRSARFRLLYERFREILALNDTTLQLIADIEDRLAGRDPFALDPVVERVRKAMMDVFVMVKDLNQITNGAHQGLYEALSALNRAVEAETAFRKEGSQGGALVVEMEDDLAADPLVTGSKMAHLATVKALGFPVPDGFTISTAAFAALMDQNGLWERVLRLEGVLEARGQAALADACREVNIAIMDARIPTSVVEAASLAFDRMAAGGNVMVAVRSSAVGEDRTTTSHAGQYRTELGVQREGLFGAYLRVVASVYSPSAVSYRYGRGLTASDAAMAVGCIRMIEPRCAGVLFTRKPDAPEADCSVLAAVEGLADGLVSGTSKAREWLLGPGMAVRDCEWFSPEESARVAGAGRIIEAHYGRPQDIEWAIDREGCLSILQARPLILEARDEDSYPARPRPGGAPLMAGGVTACAGVGAGPVVRVTADERLDGFSEGGVLVARHSSPAYARVLSRCAAIVTDVGSPAGHMAILAREFRVPAIVGMEGAFAALEDGRTITVDAGDCAVYEGKAEAVEAGANRDLPPPDSPARESLRRVARLVTPLRLTDPSAPDFSPAGCRSLHDITRFVHEKVFEATFHYGDMAAAEGIAAFALDARLPIVVRVVDVGGGLVDGAGQKGRVGPSDIASLPMNAFLEGLLEPAVRWDQPRPLSARGFMSVLGAGLAAPPPETIGVGQASYAVISDRYMNFSTKAGYHFSTVDTYCGLSQNKNYIHFRFFGGAADADRRTRRVRFVARVLDALEFRVSTKGDLLSARMEKYPRELLRERLTDLGRMTLVTRQLDMLMDSDASPEYFAAAFLKGEWERF